MKTLHVKIRTATFALTIAILSGCATPEKDPFDAYHPKTATIRQPVKAAPTQITNKAMPLDIKPIPENGLSIMPISTIIDIHPTEPTEFAITPILPTWDITKGSSLKNTLAAWCKQAGCDDVSWELTDADNTDDFKFSNNITYNGTFARAVYRLSNDMKEIMPFKPVYYTENRILRILPPSAGALNEN